MDRLGLWKVEKQRPAVLRWGETKKFFLFFLRVKIHKKNFKPMKFFDMMANNARSPFLEKKKKKKHGDYVPHEFPFWL